MLRARELRQRPGPERDGRAVRRHVHLRRLSPLLATLCATALIAGCGGGDGGQEAGTSTATGAGGALPVAALGDSITAGSPLYDPDPQARASFGFGDDERSQFEYWAHEADPALELENCGVFGERTDEIAARLPSCAEGAEVLIVQGGINDIAQALAGGPDAASDAAREAVANIDAMVAEGQELGLRVAVANVLPWNNGHPVADPAIAELNDGIARIARRRDATLLDFHAALEDDEEAGVMAPALTEDGDHPSIAGYRLLGELVAAKLG